jgi:pyruvate/2-oxoglutarate dehydrogenase complex dihydrolipoamide acyltransferase (E2) component
MMRGRAIKLSAPRRLVGDLMRFSIGVPRVTVQRQMTLGSLVAARKSLQTRPSWTAIFLKAYALLARETPELRRAYVKLPRPHLFEYPVSVASVAYEREHEGERAVLLSLIKGPERLSIAELEALMQGARSRPVMEVKEFRRALNMARAPAPVRRLLMWLGLNIARQRANYFGTFQLSVYSGLGAESLNPLTPLTTLLNYGPIGEDGSVCVRIHYDHRVMDGANVARALERFEQILNGAVANEVAERAENTVALASKANLNRA